MPSVSRSQQRFMGLVHAVQAGKAKSPSTEISQAASSISPSDAQDFAGTKHKGLPEHVTAKAARAVNTGSGVAEPVIIPWSSALRLKAGRRLSPPRKKSSQESIMTKDAAVRQMCAYLCGLSQKVPTNDLSIKLAGTNQIIKLAQTLHRVKNLHTAIAQCYPEKTAAEQAGMALRLIRGLSHRKTAFLKKALGRSTVPLGVSSHPSAGMSGKTNGIAVPTVSNIKVAESPSALGAMLGQRLHR